VEEGGFKYDSDSYADDLPYWTLDYGDKHHLIIPYTLSENDMRFVSPSNFSNGNEFSTYLKDTLK
jgi:allantoinase